MAALPRRLLTGVATALAGLAGVAAVGRCGGSACTSCLACVAPGAAVLVAALGSRVGRSPSRHDHGAPARGGSRARIPAGAGDGAG